MATNLLLSLLAVLLIVVAVYLDAILRELRRSRQENFPASTQYWS